MIKTTLRIDGMMCGMCEAHVNDAIRARFNVKKVTSSHAKGECVILSEEALDETALRAAIAGTGYELKSLNSEEYKKKRFPRPVRRLRRTIGVRTQILLNKLNGHNRFCGSLLKMPSGQVAYWWRAALFMRRCICYNKSKVGIIIGG